MWDQYDWISCESLILPSVEESFTDSVDYQSIPTFTPSPTPIPRRDDKRMSRISSFPKFRSKLKSLLLGDRSQPSGIEESIASNPNRSISFSRLLNGANSKIPPPHLKSEVDTNQDGSSTDRSRSNCASTNAFDTRGNIQTSADQTHQSDLSDPHPLHTKRRSMLQKVPRGVSRSKDAVARPLSIQAGTATPVARPLSIQAGTATPLPIYERMLLKKERRRPQSMLPSPHTRPPTMSRLPFELTSTSIRETSREF